MNHKLVFSEDELKVIINLMQCCETYARQKGEKEGGSFRTYQEILEVNLDDLYSKLKRPFLKERFQ